jgi:hypothetical protein
MRNSSGVLNVGRDVVNSVTLVDVSPVRDLSRATGDSGDRAITWLVRVV